PRTHKFITSHMVITIVQGQVGKLFFASVCHQPFLIIGEMVQEKHIWVGKEILVAKLKVKLRRITRCSPCSPGNIYKLPFPAYFYGIPGMVAIAWLFAYMGRMRF